MKIHVEGEEEGLEYQIKTEDAEDVPPHLARSALLKMPLLHLQATVKVK